MTLFAYFALCFIFSWSIWIAAGTWAPDATALVLPGAWVPTVLAVAFTWQSKGRRGVGDLVRSLLKWRVAAGYYAFAVLGVLGIVLVAVAIHALLGGSPPDITELAGRFGVPPEQRHLMIVIAPILFVSTIFVGGPIAEELGWRGYAQPRMQACLGAGRAGLIIGLVWSLWHLPMFHYFPTVVGDLPLTHYIPLVSALGVMLAWIYNRTGGSVLLCVLLHAGANFAAGVVGAGALSEDRQLLTIFVALMVALAFVLYRQIGGVREVPAAPSEAAHQAA